MEDNTKKEMVKMLAKLFTVKNVLNAAGVVVAIAGLVIDGKKASIGKVEVIDEAAAKAAELVLEKLSKNQ